MAGGVAAHPRPGGVLLFTAHGRRFRDQLSDADASRFDAGELVVLAGGTEGTNHCAAFHPPGSVEAQLLDGFELLRHVDTLDHPEDPDAWNYGQDAYLLRKV